MFIIITIIIIVIIIIIKTDGNQLSEYQGRFKFIVGTSAV